MKAVPFRRQGNYLAVIKRDFLSVTPEATKVKGKVVWPLNSNNISQKNRQKEPFSCSSDLREKERERERKLVVAKTGFTAFFELLVRLIPGRGTAGGRKLDDDDAAATFIPSKRFFAILKKNQTLGL